MKVSRLDEMLGAPARLVIVATVANLPPMRGVGCWTFTALREETGLADGNLYVQTQKLIVADYLRSYQVKRGNRRVTGFELTDKGRAALQDLVGLLRDALAGKTGLNDLAAEKPRQYPRIDGSKVW